MQQINELEGLPKRVLNNTTTASSTEPETYFEVKGVNDSIEPQGIFSCVLWMLTVVVLTTRNPNPALDSYYKRINEEANSVRE